MLDLNAHGIKDTAALLGGWNGWKDAKLPIVATKTKSKVNASKK